MIAYCGYFGLERRIVVERGPHRRQAALDRGVALVLDVAQAADRLERLLAVLAGLGDREVEAAQRHLGGLAGLHTRVGREAEHFLAGLVGGLELLVGRAKTSRRR